MGKTSMRHFFLIFFGTLAGFLGGIMMPYPLGVRGAVLGFFLSLEIVMINNLNAKRLDAEKIPSLLSTILVSLIAGLACGAILDMPILHYPERTGESAMFFPYIPAGLGVYVITMLYCVLIPSTYHAKWKLEGMRPVVVGILLIAVIYIICVARYGLLAGTNKRGLSVVESFLFSLFAALPFGILWTTALFCCDPAWSFERWKRMKE